ncbi:MAG TPA: lipocalin family protein [Burkholderiales bacterium]|nr:lipocalin family protein [Burkholderiales bacterium]
MRLLILSLVLFLTGCANGSGRDAVPLETVEGLEIDRYLGKWYEIGRLPFRVQEGCVATTATYTRIDEKHIRVMNECRQERFDGKLRRASARAWVAGDDPARLKVQFFWPFRADYWVIALDPEYRWAMVGQPSRKYLWILAREPQIPEAVYLDLLERAAAQGYDVSRMQRTPQPPS